MIRSEERERIRETARRYVKASTKHAQQRCWSVSRESSCRRERQIDCRPCLIQWWQWLRIGCSSLWIIRPATVPRVGKHQEAVTRSTAVGRTARYGSAGGVGHLSVRSVAVPGAATTQIWRMVGQSPLAAIAVGREIGSPVWIATRSLGSGFGGPCLL